MEKQYKFGIIGCGMISPAHAKAIESLPRATLAGVTDYNAERAAEFAKQWGAKAYASTQEMLSDPEIDIVCICTPSGYHAEGALEALQHGKHVVLEKPMAFTAEECRKIDETAKENGCVLTVICQLRFSEGVISDA